MGRTRYDCKDTDVHPHTATQTGTYVCIMANPSHITNCCVCLNLHVFALLNAYPLPCLYLDKLSTCVQAPMWLWSMPQNTQLHLWAHCRGHVWVQHGCTSPHCWILQARHCVRLIPQWGECGPWDCVWPYPLGPCWQDTVCEAYVRRLSGSGACWVRLLGDLRRCVHACIGTYVHTYIGVTFSGIVY